MASGVFTTISVQKPFIPVKVLCENVKYFSLFGHKNVCEEDIGSNEEFPQAGSFDSYFVDDIVFLKIRRSFRMCDVFFLATGRDDTLTVFNALATHFTLSCFHQRVHFSLTYQSCNEFNSHLSKTNLYKMNMRN
jgi:hypothetical protein